MAAIEVSGLCKRYGELDAVSGVDFEVAEGEVFCLLGPNGAGKTTTTEILEGYRARDGGTVRVLGLDPQSAPRPLRERVGIVLQSCGVQEDLSVGELLEMYGRYHLRRRDPSELIDLVELDAKRETRARNLSGGQRRRLDLALALVGDPDLVFLDEPTTGLPGELGGRDLRPSEIRFTLPRADIELPELPGHEVEREGERVLIRTGEPVRATARVTAWALEQGLALEHFSVTQPTLEDVYLALTGEGA